MIRVLHVVETLRRGGLERIVVSVANGLQARGSPQAVCCLAEPGPLAASLDPAVSQFASCGRPNRLSLPFAIGRVIRSFRPDAIHIADFASWPDTTAAALLHPGIRRVRAFHGFLARPPLRYRLAGRMLARLTHRLLAVTSDLADQAARTYGIARHRIQVCPNGVSTDRFDPPTVCRPAARSELGLRPGFVCVTTASLTAVKNPLLLVEVARRIGTAVQFVWVGDGPLRAQVQQRIRQAGLADSFHLVGAVDDVRPYLAAADLFVLPSLSEALPVSVLEAMSMRLPIVATRTGSLESVVTASDCGVVVETNDADGIACAILRLRDDEAVRRRLANRGRQAVNARYSLAAMLDRYEQFFCDSQCGTGYQPNLASAGSRCLTDSTLPMVTAIPEGLA